HGCGAARRRRPDKERVLTSLEQLEAAAKLQTDGERLDPRPVARKSRRQAIGRADADERPLQQAKACASAQIEVGSTSPIAAVPCTRHFGEVPRGMPKVGAEIAP